MTNEERKAFEVYAVGMCYNIERYDPEADSGLGGYKSSATVVAHLAWQAAIAYEREAAEAKQCRCSRCTGSPAIEDYYDDE